MQAIEFEAVEKNGSIKIPQKYAGKIKHKVRVIILIEKETSSKKVAKSARAIAKHFKAARIKTKGFVFDREEANAR